MELLDWMRSSVTRSEHDRRLAVWLTHLGHTASQVALMLGVSTPSVWRWVSAYNLQGPSALKAGAWGGRRWGFLTVAQEAQLMASLAKQAQDGKILTAKQVRKHIATVLGKEVSLDYVYRLMHRNGWRKLAPRPTHVRADPEARETFKKSRPNSLRKP
jgi:transposase